MAFNQFSISLVYVTVSLSLIPLVYSTLVIFLTGTMLKYIKTNTKAIITKIAAITITIFLAFINKLLSKAIRTSPI